MRQLPPEIWVHIASYIPQETLQNLYSVNATLYNIALNLRYNDITLTHLDRPMLRTLQRLKDPVIAQRVHRLHIQISFFHLLCKRESIPRVLKQITRRLLRLGHNIFHPHRPRPHVPNLESSASIIRAFHNAITALPNLTEYTLAWDRHRFNLRLWLFARLAWPRPSTKLRKLSLSARPAELTKLLAFARASGTTSALEDLSLTLTDDLYSSKDPLTIIHNSIAPFIHTLSPTLTSLTLSSQSHIDLSPLFHALSKPTLPHLTHLSLSIPADPSVFAAPSSLTTFLRLHAPSLTHLALEPVYAYYGPTRPLVILPGLAQTPLPNLHTLHLHLPSSHHLYIPNQPPGAPPELIPIISRFAPSLSALIIEGHALTPTDLHALAAAFIPHTHLHTLTLTLQHLTPSLIDLLATTFPTLHSLTLHYTRLTGSQDPTSDPAINSTTYTALEHSFTTELRTRTYPNWSLREAHIYHTASRGRACRWDIVDILATSVPGLRR